VGSKTTHKWAVSVRLLMGQQATPDSGQAGESAISPQELRTRKTADKPRHKNGGQARHTDGGQAGEAGKRRPERMDEEKGASKAERKKKLIAVAAQS